MVTGSTRDDVLVRKASRAGIASATVNGRSTTRYLAARELQNDLARHAAQDRPARAAA